MFKQVANITGLNLKSIPERWRPSLVIVVGLAGVVAVFTTLLAMADGFTSTLKASGRNDVAIILRGGAGSEINSVFDQEAGALIKQLPGIQHGPDGKPLAAAELMVITELMKKGENANSSNITMRGVEDNSFKLRPNLQIVEGRKFTPGLHELIAGRGVARQFDGVAVGGTIHMRGSEWKVVGVFESGDAYESELWADVGTAQSTFGRTGYSSVLAKLDGAGAADKIAAAAKADPRLNIEVKTQQAYFSDQTKQFRATINVLAGIVVVIMALGAIFAALNTMYSAVAARSREIATLRAIGFGPLPVMISVMVEAILLSLVGGVIGALIVYFLFNNVALSTLGQNLAQVVFSFKVTPSIMLHGLLIALVIGTIGGLLPSMRASRLPVTTALRKS